MARIGPFGRIAAILSGFVLHIASRLVLSKVPLSFLLVGRNIVG
jgi:hypothetical protein